MWSAQNFAKWYLRVDSYLKRAFREGMLFVVEVRKRLRVLKAFEYGRGWKVWRSGEYGEERNKRMKTLFYTTHIAALQFLVS